MISESTGQMETRLRAGGRWEQFQSRFRELKTQGVDGSEAWAMAKDEFGPAQCVTNSTQGNVGPQDENWQALHTGVGDRVCSELDAIRWVSQHCHAKPESISAESCPGGSAINLLRWVQASPANETVFWQSSFTKLLPSKSSMPGVNDADEPEVDESTQSCIHTIEKLLRGRERAFEQSLEQARGRRDKILALLAEVDAELAEAKRR
jgi:hypothetical protein